MRMHRRRDSDARRLAGPSSACGRSGHAIDQGAGAAGADRPAVADGAEVLGQRLGRRITLRRVLGQAGEDDGLEVARQVGADLSRTRRARR